MDNLEKYCREVDRLNRAQQRARFRQEIADGLRVIAAAKAAGLPIKGRRHRGGGPGDRRGGERAGRRTGAARPVQNPGQSKAESGAVNAEAEILVRRIEPQPARPTTLVLPR
jgi:hypothetical protein